jgi:hypothetical protein
LAKTGAGVEENSGKGEETMIVMGYRVSFGLKEDILKF